MKRLWHIFFGHSPITIDVTVWDTIEHQSVKCECGYSPKDWIVFYNDYRIKEWPNSG